MLERARRRSTRCCWRGCCNRWIGPARCPARRTRRPACSTGSSVTWSRDITNQEDWRACESVQRNTASPGFQQGPFSPWESDVWREMTTMARGYRTGRLAPYQPAGAGVGSTR